LAQGIRELGQGRAVAAFAAAGRDDQDQGGTPTDTCGKWAGEDSRRAFTGSRIGARWMHTPTGENIRVDNLPNYWWIDQEGNVVVGPPEGKLPVGNQRQYTRLQMGFRE